MKRSKSRIGPVILILVLAVAAVFALAAFGPYQNGSAQNHPAEPAVVIEMNNTAQQRNQNHVNDQPSDPSVVPSDSQNSSTSSSDQVSAPVVRYVGPADWHVYHRLTCKHARRIQRDNLVAFASAAAARAAGYVPCKVCNPN